jgi:uncharacterized protein YraI
MRLAVLIIGLLSLLASGCGAADVPSLSTPTAIFSTSTLPPTAEPSLTPPPPTPSPAPTATPFPGLTSTQLYVRGQPASTGAQLGLIGPATTVQILGKDLSGNWYQIAYPQSQEGKGWVAAQFVQVQSTDAIPVIGGEAGYGASAVIQQQVNVRSGPGTDFDSLGTLNPKDVLPLLGKDSSGTWLQIEYPNGPGGKGWISARYVQTSGEGSLPIVAENGQAVGTGTPTPVPLTPTATLMPAADDHDTAEAPAISFVFSPSGSGALIYTSDLSLPPGDAADWIAFTTYEAAVTIALACSGNGSVIVDLSLSGRPVPNWGGPSCGDSMSTTLMPGQQYVLSLSAADSGDQPTYVRYSITVEGWP